LHCNSFAGVRFSFQASVARRSMATLARLNQETERLKAQNARKIFVSTSPVQAFRVSQHSSAWLHPIFDQMLLFNCVSRNSGSSRQLSDLVEIQA
jgi:hypothetical protein